MENLTRRSTLKMLLSATGAMALAPVLARAQGETQAATAAAATEGAANPLIAAKVGVRKVSDNITMLLGAGGNIAVLAGKTSALVVDAGLPNRAKDVLTAVKAVAGVPARLLVNTHWHFDHVGGNEALAGAGATIVAHETTRKYLGQKMTVDFMKMDIEPSPEAARPVVTLKDTLTLHADGETVVLTHIPPAHTDTDVIVHFRNADVLHTGDLFFNGIYPFIDYGTGGNMDGMIAASEALLKLVGEKTKIVPGHGALATRAELQAYRDMLMAVRDAIRPLVEAGKDAAATVAEKPLAKLDEKWGRGMFDSDTFARLVHTMETKRLKK